MDFTNKPSDFKKTDEDALLADIDEKPLESTEKQAAFEPAPVVAHSGGGKGKKALGVTLLVLLIVGLAGAAGWFWWQNSQTQTELSSLRAANEDKERQIAALKSQQEKTEAEARQAEQEEAAQSDQKAVEAAAKAYAQVVVPQGAQATVKVDKVESGFAAVTLTGGSDTTKLLLKKAANGEWVVISDDADNLTQQEINTYKIPASFQ